MYELTMIDCLKFMKRLETEGKKVTIKDIRGNFSPFSEELTDHLLREGFICQPDVPLVMDFGSIPDCDFDTYALTEKGYLFLDNHQRMELLTEAQKKREFRRGLLCGALSGIIPQIVYITINTVSSLL